MGIALAGLGVSSSLAGTSWLSAAIRRIRELRCTPEVLTVVHQADGCSDDLVTAKRMDISSCA